MILKEKVFGNVEQQARLPFVSNNSIISIYVLGEEGFL